MQDFVENILVGPIGLLMAFDAVDLGCVYSENLRKTVRASGADHVT